MNSTSPSVASVQQDGGNSVERLRDFMKTHNVSLQDLAKLLRTPPETLEDWFNDGLSPPAAMLAVMILLESAPQAWSLFGIEPGKTRKALVRLTQEEALKTARAI